MKPTPTTTEQLKALVGGAPGSGRPWHVEPVPAYAAHRPMAIARPCRTTGDAIAFGTTNQLRRLARSVP